MRTHRIRGRFWHLTAIVVLASCGASDHGTSKQSASSPRTEGATAPGPSSPAASEVIWEGLTQGIRVRWTTHDITATESGQVGRADFSLAAEIRKSFDREMASRQADEARIAAEARTRAEAAPPPNPCTQESRVTILSIVGSVLSYQETRSTSCEKEAHPSGETRFVAVDFARPGPTSPSGVRARPLLLTDLFPAKAVLAALQRDAVVQRALQGVPPKELAELQEALASSPPVVDEKQCYSFPDDLLSRFAFHHIEEVRVAVGLGLPGAGPCRENSTQIGILLPTPDALATALTAADSRKEGFLMKEADAIAQGRQMTVTFRSSP